MTDSGGPKRGYLPCLAASVCSVLFPGAGHLAIKAKWKPAMIGVAVLNLAATITAAIIIAPVRSRRGLADVIANRSVFAALGISLLVLAVTRLWSAIDAAWLARPLATADAATTTDVAVATDVATTDTGPVADTEQTADTDANAEHEATDDTPAGIPAPVLAVAATTGAAAALTPARRRRPSRIQIAAAATTAIVIVAAVAPLTIAADYVRRTDGMLQRVFSSHEATTANPAPITTDTTGTGAGTTDTSNTPTTVEPFAGVDRVNILLIGGDAAEGRPGLRTDSMIVVSIDPKNGDTAVVSVPRNLPAMPFPPGTPLAAKFPHGFDNLANAVWGYVNAHRELAGGGDDAASQGLKQGMAQLLGIPINYYVLVDMGGFVKIIDALGGVDIYVAQREPTPGNPEGGYHSLPKFIEAGQQHMDGTLALAYSRTREADSDYHRMARQRCMLAAIVKAATPMSVALGLPDLMSAFGDAVRTDIPRTRLGEFATIIDRFSKNGGTDKVRTLHLAPPTMDSTHWKPQQVRDLVRATLYPAPVDLSGLPTLQEECHAA